MSDCRAGRLQPNGLHCFIKTLSILSLVDGVLAGADHLYTKALKYPFAHQIEGTVQCCTALNCALDLVSEGVLERFGVQMIGASQDAIDKAEDRERFDKAMKSIGLETPRSAIAHSMEEASSML